jgi:hypothetical protein
MVLDAGRVPSGESAGPVFATPMPSTSVATLYPPLAQLGPVLLLRRRGEARDALWRLRTCIDSYGVRESLSIAGWRLFRLPDSDYLGWERLGAHCIAEVERDRAWHIGVRARASLVQAGPRGWHAVRRLSGLGWDVAQQILKREAATLCDAAWRD